MPTPPRSTRRIRNPGIHRFRKTIQFAPGREPITIEQALSLVGDPLLASTLCVASTQVIYFKVPYEQRLVAKYDLQMKWNNHFRQWCYHPGRGCLSEILNTFEIDDVRHPRMSPVQHRLRRTNLPPSAAPCREMQTAQTRATRV